MATPVTVTAALRCGSMTSGRVRQFQWGARGDGPSVVHDRILTAANAISVVRLLGLPVFVWLLLGREDLLAAFGLLAAVAATDWVDGYVARRFDQVTRLGTFLDPLIDRLLVITVAVSLLVAGLLPLWLVAAVVGRDVALLAGAFALFRGIPPIPVTRTGKAATAALLVALPGFLLGNIDWDGAPVFLAASWTLAAVGLAAYYIAGAQYARAVRDRF